MREVKVAKKALAPITSQCCLGGVTDIKITAAGLRALKGRQRIAALTAYDFPMTQVVDQAGAQLILVGDSLGMVVLGYPDTTLVTMEDMLHHVRAAARAKPKGLLAADLPYGSYATPTDAVANAHRLVAAGAEAVRRYFEQVWGEALGRFGMVAGDPGRRSR